MSKLEKSKENQKKHEEKLQKYKEEIDLSVTESAIFEYKTPEYLVVPLDTVSAAFEYGRNSNTAILNFASFTTPGGGYLTGAKAQEEDLCDNSILLEVLEQFRDTWYSKHWKSGKKGLYLDELLYSNRVLFEKDDNIEYFNVITCAAPNWNYFSKSDVNPLFKRMKNTRALRNRIGLIFRTAMDNNIDTLILGAWGCGVFGQDPELVARQFKIVSSIFPEIKCIYAIPKGENYDAFKKVFKEIPE